MLISVLLPRPFHLPFTYSVPANLERGIACGDLVIAPLGKQRLVGCVWSIDQEACEAQLSGKTPRPICARLVGAPRLKDPLRALITRLAHYYHCPLGEALKLALPSISTQRALTLNPQQETLSLEAWEERGLPRALWEPAAQLSHLLKQRPLKALDVPFSISKLEWAALHEHGVVCTEELPTLSPPVLMVRCERPSVISAKRALSLTARLHLALEKALDPPQEGVSLPALAAQLETSVGKLKKPLRALIEAGVVSVTIRQTCGVSPLEEVEIETQALPTEHAHSTFTPFSLTQEQREASERIMEAEGFEAFLLHGVTGSGKTEVYLEVIERALEQGKSALVLVPEIGLTPQTMRRFQERLGVEVLPWHSALSPRERLDVWWALAQPHPKVLIGARSALFAPLSELGVIVVDESHDSSYKQGEGVRYHARDMAVLRAMLEGCPVVMGSATPSLECIHNASSGKYVHLQLKQRPLNAQLPDVHLIDLKTTRVVSDNAPAFSLPLAQALSACLKRGEQSILYLNRRGFSQSVRCLSCGFIFKCRACELSLPWHQKTGLLECHHCEFKAPLPQHCPDCHQGSSFAPIGRGTERIEQQVKSLFPTARVLRLDRDSDLNPLALERVMREGEVDVLIGTQMVTKGHDFPNVTLVGVLDADGALGLPDFRAAERSYQLISQVSGRAGRSTQKGEVYLQTYRPDDELLQAARFHDFGRFASHEMSLRRAVGYPPLSFMATLRLEGEQGELLSLALTDLSKALSLVPLGVSAQGPNLAPIEQVRGRKRWIAALRSPQRPLLHKALDQIMNLLLKTSWSRSLRVIIDVDPLDFL